MSIKSLFFEEEAVPLKPTPPPMPVTYAPQPYTAALGVDPEIRATLLQSLADKKLPGYDYLKFVAALGGNEGDGSFRR
jgi:hypothetical protein